MSLSKNNQLIKLVRWLMNHLGDTGPQREIVIKTKSKTELESI